MYIDLHDAKLKRINGGSGRLRSVRSTLKRRIFYY
nr:MAG TPA: hypothetical protein [Caudoviricetes sp.]